MEFKYKEKLINDIIELEKELWIPMHRMGIKEVEAMSFNELALYYNKLVIVRDNPV